MNIFQKSFQKLKQQQQLLAILIFGLVAVIFWIAVTIFTSQRRQSISAELQQLAKPLTPSIDETVLNRIEDKRAYSQEELAAFPIYRLVQSQAGGGEIVVAVGEEPPTVSEEEINDESSLEIGAESDSLEDLSRDEESTISAGQL